LAGLQELAHEMKRLFTLEKNLDENNVLIEFSDDSELKELANLLTLASNSTVEL
jgi:hypothetical protein